MVQIREAKGEEIEEVSALLAPAFEDKVMAVVGDMKRAMKIIPTVIKAIQGTIFVAVEEEKRITGAMIITTEKPKFLVGSLWSCLKNLGLRGTWRAYLVVIDYLKSLPERKEKEGVLEAVGVLQSVRGKGVGRELVKRGEEYLKERGLEYFGLGVKKESPAVRFYMRLGFEVVCQYKNKLGEWFYMRKKISHSLQRKATKS